MHFLHQFSWWSLHKFSTITIYVKLKPQPSYLHLFNAWYGPTLQAPYFGIGLYNFIYVPWLSKSGCKSPAFSSSDFPSHKMEDIKDSRWVALISAHQTSLLTCNENLWTPLTSLNPFSSLCWKGINSNKDQIRCITFEACWIYHIWILVQNFNRWNN